MANRKPIDLEGVEELFGDHASASSEEGENLFDDQFERDYDVAPDDILDRYDSEDLDDQQYDRLAGEERRRVEKELRKRDRERRQQAKMRRQGVGQVPMDLMEGRLEEADLDYMEDASEDLDMERVQRYRAEMEETSDEAEIDAVVRGPVREWMALEANRRAVSSRLTKFLLLFVGEGTAPIYGDRISSMCAANAESLEVDYQHLCSFEPHLALTPVAAPEQMLNLFDEVAKNVVLKMFPEYTRIASDIHVRISGLPVQESIRDLRQQHLNQLVKVGGVVTRRTGVFPQLVRATYTCTVCRFILGPFVASGGPIEVRSCSNCNAKGPFTLNHSATVYRNFQVVTLQESPGSVEAGRIPRTKDVVLCADLIDIARPGEEVEVTGVFTTAFDPGLNIRHGFPVFSTTIVANHIVKRDDELAGFRLSEEDERQIRALARDPGVGDRIIKSIAPSIYGHEVVKAAVALALFGGESKRIPGRQHHIRGDINVLLMGDPGTAKSQFLKYAEHMAHRAVYATGQGASAVGLTASVHLDPVTREWTLEGGALVLADKGVCLIDEFDKMSDKDRTSIHEAMEQQTISISKAGIVTTLSARCAVIAAANPLTGRYRPALSFAQNVDLTEPILSRFDILCVVRDIVDPVADESLARFVVASHRRSHRRHVADNQDGRSAAIESAAQQHIPQDLLRKYIVYARRKVRPQLINVDKEKIVSLYTELRAEALRSGGVAMTVRHVESTLRMAEASARMHLRDYVNDDDVNLAVRVSIESFVAGQKYTIAQSLRHKFRKYIALKRDHNELLLFILQRLVSDEAHSGGAVNADGKHQIDIRLAEFEHRAQLYGITDVTSFFGSNTFISHSFSFHPETRLISWVGASRTM